MSRLAGAPLPPPRRPDGPYVVAVVCLGNICRSPTAAVVLRQRLADAGLDDRVQVESGGTGPWHVGEPMDRRAAAALSAAGLDPSAHRGRQVDADWFGRADLVLAMDGQNLADLRELARRAGLDVAALEAEGRLRLFRDLDPDAAPGSDVPDPYYGGDDGFLDVLAMVEHTCEALVSALPQVIDPGRGEQPIA